MDIEFHADIYADEALATSLTEQIAAHRKAIATYVPYY